MGYGELLIRITVSFFVLFILTRIMGRKEISQMTFSNFVSAIAIGEIAGTLALVPDIKIIYGVIGLVAWSFFTILMALIDLKSKNARIVIEGEPLIVIKKGQIIEKSLRKTRLSVDALNTMLRKKDVFSIADVEFAIFETDGELSVMKKEYKLPATKKDLNIETSEISISPIDAAIVSDGVMDQKNLTKLNIKPEWLEQKLQQAGVQDIRNVLYAEIQQDGNLYINKKNDILH
ncbi:DUF421 domain-containing protein [Neobacillus drentensis]|uniref:DUF421 domain-containing protein n=1 Tax=Neobacillus drentensis TaxID=220684 RepID=UPI00082489F1|nr:DUF421 domain-containing protein [Neobacillus drentensis]